MIQFSPSCDPVTVLCLRNQPGSPPAATVAMEHIQRPLDSAVSSLSDQTYEKSFAYFRLWFGIGQTYSPTPSDLIFNTIFTNRAVGSLHQSHIYPAAHLILRLVNDVELDPILAPHSTGLRSRFCARILQQFFDDDLYGVYIDSSIPSRFYVDTNLIAHYANLGYIEEDTIRNYILQSLISHTKVRDHQVIALAILFKIAGATFGAYVDPAVVDRCFELFKNRHRDQWTGLLIQVSERVLWAETLELRQNSRK